MKCLTFTGAWYEVANLFNKWAKDKGLHKDVIIHSHQNVFIEEGKRNLYITIIIFFDEALHPDWVGKVAKQKPQQWIPSTTTTEQKVITT